MSSASESQLTIDLDSVFHIALNMKRREEPGAIMYIYHAAKEKSTALDPVTRFQEKGKY